MGAWHERACPVQHQGDQSDDDYKHESDIHADTVLASQSASTTWPGGSVRIRFTLDITRTPRPEPEREMQHEHRDNDTAIESQPGWPETHRIGFVPAPEWHGGD
jgi:hypothetical protein